MAAIERVDIFEDLYVKDSNNIDVSSLARWLEVHQKDLIKALDVKQSTVSKKGIDSSNKEMKLWMMVFNIAVDLIEESDPELDKHAIQLKMSRWLRLPNSHFGGESLLGIMMMGKVRKVVRFLEQLDK